jgi:hypothetical protein
LTPGITVPDGGFPRYKSSAEGDRARATERAFKQQRSLKPERKQEQSRRMHR